MHKGINQIDFAVAISVIIFLFAFTVSTVSDYYSIPIQSIDRSELRDQSVNMWDLFFFQEGVPSDWHVEEETIRPSLGGNIWKTRVHIKEYNKTGGKYNISVPIDVGEENGVPKAWNGSIKAYHDGEPLMTDIKSEENGFLGSFDVVFELNIADGEEMTVDVYYSQDRTTNASYGDLEKSTEATVNITIFSERGIESVSGHKTDAIKEIETSDIRGMYGHVPRFNVSFDSSDRDFSHGERVPEEVSTERYSRRILYQNKAGYIEIVDPEVVVW